LDDASLLVIGFFDQEAVVLNLKFSGIAQTLAEGGRAAAKKT